MSDAFADMMASANACSMHDLGEDSVTVKYRPLNVAGDQVLISALVPRETRRKKFAEVAQSERYDLMEIVIRASDVALPRPWATVQSEGDSVLIVNEQGTEETWYVRDFINRNAGGMHHLLLATTTKPLGNEWGG